MVIMRVGDDVLPRPGRCLSRNTGVFFPAAFLQLVGLIILRLAEFGTALGRLPGFLDTFRSAGSEY
jgi:hypothetical protein